MTLFLDRVPPAVRAAPATAGNSKAQEVKKNGSAAIWRLTPREQLILFAIGQREIYALAIQQVISEASGGQERITLGTIYPILKSLEDRGFVEGEWEDDGGSTNRPGARRRYYRLTNQGLEAIQHVLDFQQRLLNGGKFSE